MDPIPWNVAAPAAVALVAAIGKLWHKISSNEKAHATALEAEREQTHYWQRKWASEIKRMSKVLRIARINDERSKGRVSSDPPPPDDFDDTTEVRAKMLSNDCHYFEAEGVKVDDLLEPYLESTPPRQRKP